MTCWRKGLLHEILLDIVLCLEVWWEQKHIQSRRLATVDRVNKVADVAFESTADGRLSLCQLVLHDQLLRHARNAINWALQPLWTQPRRSLDGRPDGPQRAVY